MKKKAPHLDIDTRDENGASPLILAALNGHCSVVQVLLSYSANVWACDQQG
jgi:ankyrin repeat protein